MLVSGAYDPAALHLNPLGLFTGVFSGLLYAIYSVMGRSASQRNLNPWTTLLYTFGFSVGFILLINLFAQGVVPGTADSLADFAESAEAAEFDCLSRCGWCS